MRALLALSRTGILAASGLLLSLTVVAQDAEIPRTAWG
jgi:hypothetical protein